MKRFSITGLNHKFAPIEIRESMAFNERALPQALKSLRDDFGVPQAVILSTCNRVEVIAFGSDSQTPRRVRDFLCHYHHVSEDFFCDHIYEHSGDDAIQHLFRVAASLDSLVLGEYQIISQIKSAYQIAQQENSCGKALNALMQRAFALAKEVRAKTAIGAGQLSVASVAVGFIKRTFDDIAEKTVLLLGAGETAQITLRHLRESGVQNIIIANRTLEKAREVAEVFGGSAIPLDLVEDYLPKTDIVVAQTGATQPIITKKMAAKALRKRRFGSLFFVDLAVPRDIAKDVGRVDGVYRYDIDDLERVVEESRESRSNEVEKVQKIVESYYQDFLSTFREISVDPLLAGIRDRADEVLEAEIIRASARIKGLAPEQEAEVANAMRRVANKILHGPLQALKEEARAEAVDTRTLELARRMFIEAEIRLPKEEHAPTPKNTATVEASDEQ